MTVYYGYFPDFGVVYLNCLDTSREITVFDNEELGAIAESLREVEAELERVKTINIRKRSVPDHDGG